MYHRTTTVSFFVVEDSVSTSTKGWCARAEEHFRQGGGPEGVLPCLGFSPRSCECTENWRSFPSESSSSIYFDRQTSRESQACIRQRSQHAFSESLMFKHFTNIHIT